ncbi:spo7-like protein [Pyrenophora tritici-repentis]|nr:spo7-like protein [Pyrenophora tritici-repentis]
MRRPHPLQSLDQPIKGAPVLHTSVTAVTAAGNAHPALYSATTSHDADDRISSLKHARKPSIANPDVAPAELILEASLRSQYLTLRARRLQSTFVLTLVSRRSRTASSGPPRHRIVENGKEYAEENIASGGDYIKLLLLPKRFTPTSGGTGGRPALSTGRRKTSDALNS